MTNTLTIAVDAMGGDGAPKKIVEGIIHHYKKKIIIYNIFVYLTFSRYDSDGPSHWNIRLLALTFSVQFWL